MSVLRVLGRTTSINVRKVLWTCAEIGIEHEQVEWGSEALPLRSAEFLALNPNALVPVVIDDGLVLRESNTICRYLALKHGRTDLLPADAAGRARVEQWMDWQATDLNKAYLYAFLALVRKIPGYTDPAAVADSVKHWNRSMTIIDNVLQETGACIVGRDLTLADIVLGLSTHRWLHTPIERPALASVARYHEMLQARPAFGAMLRADLP